MSGATCTTAAAAAASRAAAMSAASKKKKKAQAVQEVQVPSYFLCPISLELMRDPVTLSTGQTYDRESIERWVLDEGHRTCPVTRQPIFAMGQVREEEAEEEGAAEELEVIPNHVLRRMIQAWCEKNKEAGVERMETPRQPATARDVPALVDAIGRGGESAAAAIQRLTGLLLHRPRPYRRLMIQSGLLPRSGKLLSDLATSSPTMSTTTTTSASRQRQQQQQQQQLLEKALLRLLDLATDGEEPIDTSADEEQLVVCLARCVIARGLMESDVISTAVGPARDGDAIDADIGQLARGGGGGGGDVIDDAVVGPAVRILARMRLMDAARRKLGALPGLMEALVERIAGTEAAHRHGHDDDAAADSARSVGMRLMLELVGACNRNRVLAVEAGAVAVMARLLAGDGDGDGDGAGLDKLAMETALRIVEAACHCAEGRAAASQHVRLVARHMSGVSEQSSYLAVHILWLLLRSPSPHTARVVADARRANALVKAVAVAHSAASPRTRSAARSISRHLMPPFPDLLAPDTIRL